MGNELPEEGIPGEDLSVEQSFTKLDGMLEQLESEQITLEESFRIYEDGMKMLKSLSEKIETYEKQMQILTSDGEIEDFK